MKFKNKKILILITILIALAIIILIATESASKPIENSTDQSVTLENGFQVVHMTESATGYLPNSFTIKKGIPVRWEIESTPGRTCADVLIVPSYKIREFLKPGSNVLEFTPTQTGQIPFSCSMRMFTGSFNVIE